MESNQQLFERLLKADTEVEVIRNLKDAGYWDDPEVWRFYGDQPENWATVGNQQSRAEQALIEKAMNAIDTKLIAAARIAGIPTQGPDAPQSLFRARDRLFKEQLKDIEKLSNSITIAATGQRLRPSITIVDDGEGQTPTDMPATILSLHRGNKNAIPFVQGKFNMGGSGVLEFCGVNHNVELVLSKRNPQLLPERQRSTDAHWSFTVIRREDPSPASPRASRFTYLAPGGADGEGNRGLLTFQASTLPIFPNKNQAYARPTGWGTLFKLYEYGIRATTNMMLEGGLMGRVRILLPEPALPIRFHECRDYRGDPNRSFDTAMAGLIYTLEEDRKNPKRQNVEWYDKFDIDIDGEKFTGRIYLFRKREKDEKNPAESYRKDEGVVFIYNGQCHAFFSKDFFRRKAVHQDYLWDSLLIFIDCSAISVRAHERLFMPNRENLRHGELKFRLEEEIEEKLRHHEELKQIAIARRKNELSENPEVSASFEKFIEEMVKKHQLLEHLLGPGFRISNPFKPQSVEAREKAWEGKRFPTKFHFRGLEAGRILARDANLNSQVRVVFSTDAENDYFRRDEEPGEFKLFEVVGEQLKPAKNWRTPHLFEGTATLSLSLPPDATVGDVLVFEAQVTDPSRIEPFQSRFTLTVRAEREARPPSPPPEPPDPKPDKPGDEGGKDAQNDSRLAPPNLVEVWEEKWRVYDPPFDKFTAMRIKRSPGVDDGSSVFDYFINMNNVFIDQATKEQPRRARQIRDRYKFGMATLTLALIRYDVEMRKREQAAREDDEEQSPRSDVYEMVADVTTAIAPFLLPLIESLSSITGDYEAPLSAIAGEAA